MEDFGIYEDFDYIDKQPDAPDDGEHNNVLSTFLSLDDVSSEIAHYAYKIYSDSGKHVGKNERKKNLLLADCLYKAYIRNNIVVHPTVVGRKFGVGNKLSTAINENVHIDPSVYCSKYLAEMAYKYEISRTISAKILTLAREIDEKPPPFVSSLLGLACISIHLKGDEWQKEEEIILKNIGISNKKLKECLKVIKRLY